uniref:Uncharacterized protein n=1 Tax=viral metagenome TaxID=1070528 RepID=A0A6C0HBT9_9ZZZZ
MKSNLIIFLNIFIFIVVFVFLVYLIQQLIIIKKKKSYEYENKEGFLSGFRQAYRPYIRNMRLYSKNKFKIFSGKMQTIVRKFGLA